MARQGEFLYILQKEENGKPQAFKAPLEIKEGGLIAILPKGAFIPGSFSMKAAEKIVLENGGLPAGALVLDEKGRTLIADKGQNKKTGEDVIQFKPYQGEFETPDGKVTFIYNQGTQQAMKFKDPKADAGIRNLQTNLGVTSDGWIGKETAEAAYNKINEKNEKEEKRIESELSKLSPYEEFTAPYRFGFDVMARLVVNRKRQRGRQSLSFRRMRI